MMDDHTHTHTLHLNFSLSSVCSYHSTVEFSVLIGQSVEISFICLFVYLGFLGVSSVTECLCLFVIMQLKGNKLFCCWKKNKRLAATGLLCSVLLIIIIIVLSLSLSVVGLCRWTAWEVDVLRDSSDLLTPVSPSEHGAGDLHGQSE